MHQALHRLLSALALILGATVSAADDTGASTSEPALTHIITRTVEYHRSVPAGGRPPEGTLRAGTRVALLRPSIGEYQWVRTGEGLEGFVSSDALASLEQPEGKAGERITVTAALEEVTWAPLGTSSTVLEPEQTVGSPSTLANLVADLPGVSENGQGGLFQVVSIRGVSRQRITHLVSGMRMTSERRAGVSTSFLDPQLIDSVEVLGGPATTFHGSGALGGVVQVRPRKFRGGFAASGYESNADERFLAGGAGGRGWSIGLARREAGDAEAADGTRLNSHFTQYSAVASWNREAGGRRYELLAIPTYGEEIGKANTDFPARTTHYPRERHQLLKFAISAEAGWRFHTFVHAQDLETDVVEQGVSRNRVFNESFDYGFRWERERELRRATGLRFGFDGFGRRGVDAQEIVESLDPNAPTPPVTSRTLDGAEEFEAGAFVALRWRRAKFTLESGSRVSWLSQDNRGTDDRTDSSLSGYVGVSRPLGDRLEFRSSLSTGLRFPSLSELFFSGATGRGEVIGNPRLDAERSFNLQASARWLGRRVLVEAVLFHNRIDDYIERVEIAPDLLTFVNLTEGTVSGLELRGQLQPAEGWTLLWGGHVMDGREDQDHEPLADVPPDELFLAAKKTIRAWSLGARIAYRAKKDDPGSGEKEIPSAALLNLSASYTVAPGWSIWVGGNNLLDEKYFRSADRKAPLAPGRSVAVGVSWQGG